MSDYAIVKSSSGVLESANKCEVLLKNTAALSSLPDELAPGSVAYIANLTEMYMKDLDGDWQKIGGDD